MIAAELKSEMLAHILYRLHFAAAVTEYGGKGCDGIADIFGIANSGLTSEFEVKVSKADLAGELQAIKFVSNRSLLNELPEKKISKAPKHNVYLGKLKDQFMLSDPFHRRPNRFYFVIPGELEEFTKPYLQNTPYGLYVYKDHDVKNTIRAKFIHKEKPHPSVIINIVRKASMEVEILRRKNLEGLLCTKCFKALQRRCSLCIEMEKKYREDRKEIEKRLVPVVS